MRGVFYDGDGRRIGINLTQGETQDSASLSLFGRFGYALSEKTSQTDDLDDIRTCRISDCGLKLAAPEIDRLHEIATRAGSQWLPASCQCSQPQPNAAQECGLSA